MQKYISPAAREQKILIKERQSQDVLWKLQKQLFEGSTQDYKAKLHLQKSMIAAQTGQFSEKVVKEFFEKSNLNEDTHKKLIKQSIVKTGDQATALPSHRKKHFS